MGGGTSPVVRQNGFAYRNNGDTVGLNVSTGLVQNTNWTQLTNVVFRYRTLLSDTAGATKTTNYTFGLEYQINGTGGFSPVSTTTPIQSVTSAQFADDDAVTSSLVTGTKAGTFVNGVGDENGAAPSAGNISLGNNHTEVEWALRIDSAQVSAGDTIEVRVPANTVTGATWATITVPVTVNVGTLAETDSLVTAAVAQPTSVAVGTIAENAPVSSQPSVVNVGATFNTGGTDASSFPIPMPSSPVNGNLLLVVIPYDGGGGLSSSVLTEIFDEQDGGGGSVGLWIGYREIDGTEGSTVVVTPGVAENAVGWAIQIENWDGNAPEISAQSNGIGTAPDPPSFTPTGGAIDRLWGVAFSLNGGPGTVTNPPYADANGFAGTGGSGSAGGAYAFGEQSVATDDPSAWTTTSSNNWLAVTFTVEGNAGGPAGGLQPIAAEKYASIGTLAETDTPIPLESQAQSIAVGTIAETDTLIAADPVKPIVQTVGTITETDTLIAVSPAQPINQAVGTIAETDTPIAVDPVKPIVQTVGTVVETDSLISVDPVKPIIQTVGTIAETDSLIAADPVKPIIQTVGTIAETDSLIAADPVKPIIQTVGTIVETDTLIAADPVKPIIQTVGTIAETDTLISVGTAQPIVQAVGTTAETDSLITVDPVKPIIQTVGTVAETDLLVAAIPQKTAQVGTLSETDSLVAVASLKQATVGTITEVDFLITVDPVKPIIQTVGAITETDSLIAVQAVKSITQAVGTIAETDSLIAVDPVKPIVQTVGIITETDSLITVSGIKTSPIGQISETNALTNIAGQKLVSVGTLAELDVLNPIAAEKPIVQVVGVVAETETLITINAGLAKSVDIGVIPETDSLLTVGGFKTVDVGVLSELDSLVAVPPFKTVAIGVLIEANSLISVSGLKVSNIGVLAQTDSLIGIAGFKDVAVGVILENELLIGVSPVKIVSVGVLSEIGSLQILTTNPNAIVYATGDGTIQSVINEADTTTNLWQSVDDAPSAPSDTDYINNSAALSGGDAFVFFDLDDMPVSFETAVSARIIVRVRGAFWTAGTDRLYGRIYQSDESTPLSDEVELVAVSGDSSFTNLNANFTGVVPGSKAQWDGARVRFRWSDT